MRWLARIGMVMTALLATAAPALARPDAPAPIPVFLSTDVGNEIDDQWVLVHLVADPRFRLLGIASALAPPYAVPPPAAAHSAIAIRQIVEDRLGLAVHPPIVAGADLPLQNETTPRPSAGAELLLAASRDFSPAHRLTLVTTGAGTDVASGLLTDPTLAQRIRVVAMGFRSWAEGGREFNVKNDPAAWRVILGARVPVTVGAWDVTRRDLAVSRVEAAALLDGAGPIRDWLLRDYDLWYDAYAHTVEEMRRPNGTQTWALWDEVTLAYLLGDATVERRPRPSLAADLSFAPGSNDAPFEWVTAIDRAALFRRYATVVTDYVRTHAVRDQRCVTIGISPLACWREAATTP